MKCRSVPLIAILLAAAFAVAAQEKPADVLKLILDQTVEPETKLGKTQASRYWKKAGGEQPPTGGQEDAFIIFKKCRVVLDTSNFNEAARCYEELLKVSGEKTLGISTVSLINLGTAYFRLNRHDDAISRLN